MHTFKSDFIRRINATPSTEWVKMLENEGTDAGRIFYHNMLLFPFDGYGQKSLFVVLNAGGIRKYTKRNYENSRPCIIHLDPNQQVVAHHDFNNIADKLRTWLNKMWREKSAYTNDSRIVPFNHRSMPLCRPRGTYPSKSFFWLFSIGV